MFSSKIRGLWQFKRYDANNVLAVAMFGWSAVSLGTGCINNYHQAIVMRMLLGLFEVALFPSLAFLVLTAYTGQQQGKRIAILYGSSVPATRYHNRFFIGETGLLRVFIVYAQDQSLAWL